MDQGHPGTYKRPPTFPDPWEAVLALHVLSLCSSHVRAQDQLTVQSTGHLKRVLEV
jgi:hypothetical protein